MIIQCYVCGEYLVEKLDNWELEVKNIGTVCIVNIPVFYCEKCDESWCDIETDKVLESAIQEIKHEKQKLYKATQEKTNKDN